MSEDEIFRALQQGNQETKEFNRQAMIQLNQVTELLHKMLSQQKQPLPKPLTNIHNPLPSKPLQNPKGGLYALNDKMESEEEAATTNDKEVVQQLCEMLIEVTDTEEKDTGEIFDFYKEFDSDYKEEEVEEGKLAKRWGSDIETQSLRRKCCPLTQSPTRRKMKKNPPSNAKTQAHA
ncbi:hypothetical protein PIB30_093382 [Stylosanthes scabra]|uniref:Uncharacterized protein n=1 Tax=Stylosanthes scabra TaxID=79078 RepID=A0ABU6SWA5_9FABA|nr:hypothetical protein [Stylosanthes scabra]